MKMFSKLWWIFSIIGTVAALLNPYIGGFGITNIGELFFMSILFMYVNGLFKIIKSNKYNEKKIIKRVIKVNGILTYVIPSIFFLIKLFVGATVFVVAYADNIVMAPYEIWSNPQEMSIICLIVEMIFNVALLISFIGKGKIIRKTVNEYE